MSESETAANRSFVQEFYDQVFSRGDISNIDRFMQDDYIQHNPTRADGRRTSWSSSKASCFWDTHIEIIRLNSEDDMVYVFFECTLKNSHVNKVCDICRLPDGQLAEYQEIINHNVEGVKSRNGSGLF